MQYQRITKPKYVTAQKIVQWGRLQKNGHIILNIEDGSQYSINGSEGFFGDFTQDAPEYFLVIDDMGNDQILTETIFNASYVRSV